MRMSESILAVEALHGKIKERVEQLNYGENPHNLYEPMKYIMSLGGKRMRPLLVLLAYQLRGTNPDEILDAALAVELFHNFTLMHDDIMDEAPIRRGKPTVHEKWNQTVAILSGDAMLVKVYDHLLKVPPPLLSESILNFNRTAVEVCEGQQIDMNFEELAEVSEKEYLEMIRLKTAVLLGFSMQFGGILSGSDAANSQRLYEIGERMGLGFQLMDDFLDVYADKAKFGKQVGGDIIANKKTYLLISALEMANEEQRKNLTKWLKYEGENLDEKVEAVKNIYDEIGVPNLAKLKMNYYFDQAFDLLEKVEGSQEAKDVFKNYASSLAKREK